MASLIHIDHSIEHAFLEMMEHLQVDAGDFHRALKDQDFARALAELCITGMPLPVSQLVAQATLHGNFVGMAELGRHFGVRFPTKRVMRTLGAYEFPWSVDVLRQPDPWGPERRIAETHLAFLGFPPSAGGDIYSVKWWELQRFPHESSLPVRWLEGLDDEPAIANISARMQWHLLRLLPIPVDQGEYDLGKAAGPNYYVPTLAEVTTGLLLYFRHTGGVPARGKLDPIVGLTSNKVVGNLGPVPAGAEFQLKWSMGHQLFVSAWPRNPKLAYGVYVSRRLPA